VAAFNWNRWPASSESAATALERQGQRTERGDLWRAVMARNFARLHRWLSLQRERVATVWELVQAVFERDRDRDGRDPSVTDGARTSGGEARGYSQDERDRLLGRRSPVARPGRDESERPADSPKPRGKDRDDERDR